jgi:hypothetical protein
MKYKIFHPVTNEMFWAWSTDELLKEIEIAKLSSNCNHERRSVFQVQISVGKPHVKEACPDCGQALGNPIKRIPAHENLKIVDLETIRIERELSLFEIKKKIVLARRKTDTEFDQLWWKEYDEYLSSAAWKQKRQIKLERVDFICEGCGIEKAEEIHHISYRNVPYEMLFELIGMCSFCHSLMHLDKEERGNFRKGNQIEIACNGCRMFSERHGRPWCLVHNAPSLAALESSNMCGPKRRSLDPLK